MGKAGRPALFKAVEDLQKQVDEYFESGRNTRPVIIGKAPNQERVDIPVPTITGLAEYLGFESRQSFYDYEKVDKFSYTIKRARLRIERYYEESLQLNAPTGAIFALKNLGWEDKQHTDVTSGGEKISIKLHEPND